MDMNDQVLNSLLADDATVVQPTGGTGDSGQPASQENIVALPDGRKLTGEQAAEEYRKLLAESTRKSQRLAELEKQQMPATTQNLDSTMKEQILKQLKEEFGVVTKDELENERNKIRGEMALDQTASNMERSIDGSDGRPAFKRKEVIAWMQENPLKTADIETAYELMHKEDLTKWRIDQYIKAKGGNPMPGERGTVSPAVPVTPDAPAGTSRKDFRPGSRAYKDKMAEEITAMLTKKEA